MQKILSFGEILWDIIDGQPHLGGAPLNYAAHICKTGGKADILSAVGEDQRGVDAIRQVREMGVNTSLIQKNKKPTGTVLVTLKNGQPDYEIIQDVAYDAINYEKERFQEDLDHSLLYFGSLAQRSSQSQQTLKRLLTEHSFGEVFYDVNLRKGGYSKEIVNTSLSNCTIFKINDEEVPVVSQFAFSKSYGFEEFCEQLHEKFNLMHTIIITAGGEGCYVSSKGTFEQVAGVPVQVADTVGAGDSFSAAFTIKYLSSGDPVLAAEVANRVGGFVASQSGAIPEYSEEIKALF